MKKRIARIQRWVDRMSAACENKKWESALMEADCLSAEVKETREKLLSISESTLIPHKPRVAIPIFSMAVKSAGIALLIVCCSTIPSAVEADRPWVASAPKPAAEVRVERENLRWITPEEEELLKMIRADMDKAEPIYQASKPVEEKRDDRAAPSTSRIVVRDIPARVVAEQPAAKKDVSEEELLSLLQIGAKALRTGTPAVRIIQ